MRVPINTIVSCLLVSALGACADVEAPSGPAGATLQVGAVQERGTGVFIGDGTIFFDCLGEYVHVHNEFPLTWHRIVTPSGNVVFKDPFVPNGGSGRAEGLTSGTIWTIDRVISPEVIITNAGQKAFFVAITHWVSETGSSFTVHNTFHFVQNANGDVLVNSFESRCIAH
jgi:hypothetical protein